tara:strand:- start:524 stop:679 length:156 start_codon:yes stop_codon:yes gene_type:complete
MVIRIQMLVGQHTRLELLMHSQSLHPNGTTLMQMGMVTIQEEQILMLVSLL